MKKFFLIATLIIGSTEALAKSEAKVPILIQGDAAYELYLRMNNAGKWDETEDNIRCWGMEIESSEWIWKCEILVDSDDAEKICETR